MLRTLENEQIDWQTLCDDVWLTVIELLQRVLRARYRFLYVTPWHLISWHMHRITRMRSEVELLLLLEAVPPTISHPLFERLLPFYRLTELSIGGSNRLVDASAFRSLTHLKKLNLGCLSLVNDYLPQLGTLETLDVSTRVSKASFIGLTRLSALILYNMPIVPLSSLSIASNLTTLTLIDVKSPFEYVCDGVSPVSNHLRNLTNLLELRVEHPETQDLVAFSSLTKLQRLIVKGQSIESEEIVLLTNLTYLNVTPDTGLVSWDISQLERLTHLDVRDYDYFGFDRLRCMQALRCLTIPAGASIKSLMALTQLQSIIIEDGVDRSYALKLVPLDEM
jgi:hypothetical protein